MKTYDLYMARMSYNKKEKYLCSITANNLDEVDEYIKNHLHLNPYYVAVKCDGEFIYNNFCIF